MAITYNIGSQETFSHPTSVSNTVKPLYKQILRVSSVVIPLYSQSRVSSTVKPLYKQVSRVSQTVKYVYTQFSLDTLQMLGVEI